MEKTEQTDWFQDIETIVSKPLNFKAKLAIGEDAYTSLRVKNAAVQVWDVAGVATTAAVVAKSSVVATTFFAPSGLLAAIGIGTAVTPIGWVIAAGVVTGSAWYGITRHLKKASASRVTVIPNFINTPLDVLALGLFDLLVPLALKVAEVEGRVDTSKRARIQYYFADEWGYDPKFVGAGINYLESMLDELSTRDLASAMAKFASENRDCNFKLMSQEILGFLRKIVEQDGRVDQRDETAIRKIETIFAATGKFSLGRKLRSGWGAIRRRTGKVLARRKSTGDE